MPVQLKAPAEGSAAKSHGEYKNVLVYFVHGSESIDYSDQVKVQLFGTESQEPLAEYTGAQLKESYLATKCSDRLSRLLENAFLGDALFCEGSLNLSKVNKWVYVDGSGKKRSATSYILDYTQVEDDVIAVTVNFN
jgi:hypothetical protein